MLAYGANTNPITTIGIVTNAIVGQPAVLAQVAGFVASSFPFDIMGSLAALTRIGATFGIGAQQILTLIVILAEIAYGSCKSNALSGVVVRKHEVTVKAGAHTESSRRSVVLAVGVGWALGVCPANACCTSDKSLAQHSQAAAGDEEGQCCELY